jgi:hypothetical protein
LDLEVVALRVRISRATAEASDFQDIAKKFRSSTHQRKAIPLYRRTTKVPEPQLESKQDETDYRHRTIYFIVTDRFHAHQPYADVKAAVKEVGDRAADVERYLKGKKPADETVRRRRSV